MEEHGAGSLLLPPLAGIIELVVLTGLILAVDAMLPDLDIADIQPNPFWLPVLLLSLQYGTVSGLLAAGTALLVTVLSGLPEAGVGENHFSYALRVFLQPILWFAAAVLLGQFRMRQIAAKQGLRAMVIDLEQERTALAGYAQDLRRRCAVLERDRAALGEAPSVSLLARFAALRDGTGDLARDLDRLAATALPGAKLSALTLKPDGSGDSAALTLRQVAAVGWGETEPFAREISLAHPLYRVVVGEGRALSQLVAGDEKRLAGEGLAAVPIRQANGTVRGVLKLEAAEPAALSSDTVAALEAIAEALGSRLERALMPAATPHAATLAPTTGTAATSSGSAALREITEIAAPRHLRSIAWRRTDTTADTAAAVTPAPALVTPTPSKG